MNFTPVECIDNRIQIENDLRPYVLSSPREKYQQRKHAFRAARESIPHVEMNVCIYNFTSFIAMTAKIWRWRDQ
jgi:hypothetical protein